MKVAKIIFALGIIFVLAGGIILVLTFNQEEKVEPLPEYEVPVVANTILEKQMVTTSDYKKKKMKCKVYFIFFNSIVFNKICVYN